MKRNVFALLRMFLVAAIVPALSLSLVACTPEEETGSGNGGGNGSGSNDDDTPAVVVPEMSVPEGYEDYFANDISLSRSAGRVKVAFEINMDWTMEVVSASGGSASWCSVSPASGTAGLNKVMVNVSANDTYEFRSACIRLMAEDSKVAEIMVLQDCENAVLLNRRAYNVSCESTTIDVEVRANIDFDYQVLDAAWVRERQAGSRGLTTHKLVFEVDENASSKSREAQIVFYNSEYALADTLTIVQEADPEIPSYEAVDLGLSVKWAAYNIGASSPEEFGDYYAWGETEPKETYSWSNYKWCYGSYDTMTKYCMSSYYGKVDGKDMLDPEDDVAQVKWGDGWRMPTKDEIVELKNKCSWTTTTIKGVNGYKVSGNGNFIFIPYAGYISDRLWGTSYCYLWSSQLSGSCSWSWHMEGKATDSSYRYYGMPVRAVKE